MAAPETNNLTDELVPELELSVLPYKLSNRMRIEILDESFTNHMAGYKATDETQFFDENGMCEVDPEDFMKVYIALKHAYIRYKVLHGNV